MPRRGDSINFVILGLVIGHSLLQGGPGFYRFHPLVYNCIIGKDDTEFLMKFISKDLIPLNASTQGIISFITKLDAALSQSEIDEIIDEYEQTLNCSQWDPTVKVTISNKHHLVTELIFDELVRKITAQIKSIRQGLSTIAILGHLEIAQEMFVFKNSELTPTKFWNLLDQSSLNEHGDMFAKKQTLDFFKVFINQSTSDRLRKVLKFVTGFDIVPPWGLHNKVAVKFLMDDESKVYPESMACFNLVYVPTVHSTQETFNKYFESALNYEVCGFSAGM